MTPSERRQRVDALENELRALYTESQQDRNDVDTMTFSLYDGVTDDPAIEALGKQGTEAGRQVITDLLRAIDRWEVAYRRAGASDTASREAMAVNIARALGLRGYADQP